MGKLLRILLLSTAGALLFSIGAHAESLAGRIFNRTSFLQNFSFDPPYGSFAGITFNPFSQTYYMTDNSSDALFEIQADGTLIRTINIAGLKRSGVATTDAEGLTWMYGTTYAAALHDGKEIAIVNIVSTTTALNRSEARIYDVSSGPGKPKGIVYSAQDNAIYWVAKDAPKAVVKARINATTGNLDTIWTKTVDNLPASDLADVMIFPRLSPNLFLISESSKTIMEVDLTGPTAVLISSYSLSAVPIPQAGALAFGADGTFRVVGKHVSGVSEDDFNVFSPTATITNRQPIAVIASRIP